MLELVAWWPHTIEAQIKVRAEFCFPQLLDYYCSFFPHWQQSPLPLSALTHTHTHPPTHHPHQV